MDILFMLFFTDSAKIRLARAIFERLPNGLYRLNEYRFKERIYPVGKMKATLSEHFDILETNLREEGRKILFVCRKK